MSHAEVSTERIKSIIFTSVPRPEKYWEEPLYGVYDGADQLAAVLGKLLNHDTRTDYAIHVIREGEKTA
jgi:hypothetical protein